MKMKWMGRLTICALLLLLLPPVAWGQMLTDLAQGPSESNRPWEAIDVVIALDTSDSMKALIDATRLSLWDIVNDLTLLKPTPNLRVALLTYGHANNDSRKGWVRLETDLTHDLDVVSERLFALTGKGGAEYVGRVLQVSLEDLSWTPSDEALKIIFVAGNEPADQDPQVDFREMAAIARDEGILVNAIYCGRPDHPDAESWVELAYLADGQFATIDQRASAVALLTPFDEDLAALSEELSQTFIPFGEAGGRRMDSLVQQDINARKLSPAAAASRAQVKTGPLFATGWDLVQAVASERIDLSAVDEADLPQNLRELTLDERELYLQEIQERRAELSRRIAELSEERRRYAAQQVEGKGKGEARSFDAVVRKAIRRQAGDKGFEPPER